MLKYHKTGLSGRAEFTNRRLLHAAPVFLSFQTVSLLRAHQISPAGRLANMMAMMRSYSYFQKQKSEEPGMWMKRRERQQNNKDRCFCQENRYNLYAILFTTRFLSRIQERERAERRKQKEDAVTTPLTGACG